MLTVASPLFAEGPFRDSSVSALRAVIFSLEMLDLGDFAFLATCFIGLAIFGSKLLVAVSIEKYYFYVDLLGTTP